MTRTLKTVMVIAVGVLCVFLVHRLVRMGGQQISSWEALESVAVHTDTADSSAGPLPLLDADTGSTLDNAGKRTGRNSEFLAHSKRPLDKSRRIESLPSVATDNQRNDNDSHPSTPSDSKTPYRAATYGPTRNPFYRGDQANTDRTEVIRSQNRLVEPLPAEGPVANENRRLVQSEKWQSSMATTADSPVSHVESLENARSSAVASSNTESDDSKNAMVAPSEMGVDLTSEFQPELAMAKNQDSGDGNAVEQPTLSGPEQNDFQSSHSESREPYGEPSLVVDSGTANPVATSSRDEPAPTSVVPSPVVLERAREHTAYGNSLARRGSTFAARQEYLQSLRLIAESYDMQTGDRKHTSCLAAALKALTESDDFVMVDSESALTLDLKPILASHSSRIIDDSQIDQMTPIHAMQVYYEFAVVKLAQAAAKSAAASEALYALGKLHKSTAMFDPSAGQVDRTKAMVMFQASLAADPENHRSANELGVLMAENGRLEPAKDLFKQSLRSEQTKEAWRNLAKVHHQLGEHSLATLAQRELAALASQIEDGDPGAAVREVSLEEFDAHNGNFDFPPPVTPRTAQAGEPQLQPKKQNRFFKTLQDLF